MKFGDFQRVKKRKEYISQKGKKRMVVDKWKKIGLLRGLFLLKFVIASI